MDEQAKPLSETDPYQAPQHQPEPSVAAATARDDAVLRALLPVGRSGWAIAAGYLGLFSPLLVVAPVAVIVSMIAISDVRKSAGTENVRHGMGRAVFGLIMGAAFSILLAFLIVVAIQGR